jgi:ribosomal protein L15
LVVAVSVERPLAEVQRVRTLVPVIRTAQKCATFLRKFQSVVVLVRTVKILGTGSLSKALSIQNCDFSETAKSAVEAAGGTFAKV